MQHKVKSFDDVKINYSIVRKSKRFIVFLHGAGGALTAWKDERRFFHKKGYSTIAVDLRGHGKSGRPMMPSDYKLENFARDIHAVLKKEDITDFVLVGHCFGGVVVTMFHKLFPKLAKAYVLVDTTYKSPKIFYYLFKRHSFLINIINHILIRKDLRAKSFKHVDFSRFKGTSDWSVRRIYSDIVNTSFKSWLFTYQSLADFDGADILKSIRQRVLIIEGSHDSVFNVLVAHKIHDLVKASRLDIIPKANHIIVINNPDKVTAAIQKFLDSLKFWP